jgi:predicted amidohydrolase
LKKSDVPALQDLQRRCFGGLEPWTRTQIESQLSRFPEGQLCVELDGKLVASSSSLIIDAQDYTQGHSYDQVSDKGFIRNHDPEGDTLYGIDIAVEPSVRGMRLARRLYEARKELAVRHNLRAFMIAGRIPNYKKHSSKLSPEEYVRRVLRKELKDPVLTAQLANGFAVRGVLRNYLPLDVESVGHAVFMEWLNPHHHPADGSSVVRSVAVAAAQFQMRQTKSFDEFAQQCEFFVDTATEYRVDFLLFPEMITNQLQTLVSESRPGLTARRLTEFTPAYLDLFSRLALKYNVNIVAGSHLTVEDGRLFNIAYLFRRDGSHDKQYKLHVPHGEQHWWGVTPGERLTVMETDRGKIAILIGYDVQFPELARIAASSGVDVLFVPINTDIRSAYQRVRACAQARCIENQVYVVMACTVGNLPFVEGADIHYGQSCVLTPSDLPFARDGIAEEATPNVETMVVHELDLDVLRRYRRTASQGTWLDRRPDLYSVTWRDGGTERSV